MISKSDHRGCGQVLNYQYVSARLGHGSSALPPPEPCLMSPAHRNKPQPINADEAARETLLAVLEAVVCRYHWRGHALCVMDHHDHLVLETPEGNLSHGMWQLNGVYTQQCNRRHARVSTCFQAGIKPSWSSTSAPSGSCVAMSG